MVTGINQSSSIHNLFESAGRSIPDLDGHNIRVAERRILWSKIAQITPTSPEEMEAAWRAGQSVVTPEQVAQWEKAQPEEPGEPVAEQTSEESLKQLLTPNKPVPTGAAHVRKPAPPKPTPIWEAPEMKIEPLLYTPGEEDPNYVEASKNIVNLVRVANYLSKK